MTVDQGLEPTPKVRRRRKVDLTFYSDGLRHVGVNVRYVTRDTAKMDP